MFNPRAAIRPPVNPVIIFNSTFGWLCYPHPLRTIPIRLPVMSKGWCLNFFGKLATEWWWPTTKGQPGEGTNRTAAARRRMEGTSPTAAARRRKRNRWCLFNNLMKMFNMFLEKIALFFAKFALFKSFENFLTFWLIFPYSPENGLRHLFQAINMFRNLVWLKFFHLFGYFLYFFRRMAFERQCAGKDPRRTGGTCGQV